MTRRGRPRTNPLPRTEQLRLAKRGLPNVKPTPEALEVELRRMRRAGLHPFER